MSDALSRLLGRSNKPDPARADRAAAIGDLVRAALHLDPGAAVTVQELTCAEPGCPPIETKIAILGAEPKRWTIHAPMSEVDEQTVHRTLTTRPEGENPPR